MTNNTSEPESPDPKQLKFLGDEAFNSGDNTSAIQYYAHVLEINPRYTEVWENLGRALYKEGRREEAQTCIDKADKLRKSQDTKKKSPQKTKNPVIAAILSVIPGLGMVYNGQLFKGLIFLTATIFVSALFLPAGLIIWVIGIVYSFYSARKINQGLIPFKLAKPLPFVGFFVAAIILIVVVVTLQTLGGYEDGIRHINTGFEKINSMPQQPGVSYIPALESAKEDFQIAIMKLSEIHDNEKSGVISGNIFVAKSGITVCDVNIAGINAYDHHTRMNSFIQTRDFESAQREERLAKAEYEKIMAIRDKTSADLDKIDMNTVPADQWQNVAGMKLIFTSMKKYRDYIVLMDAYDHYFTSVQDNKKAGSYLKDSNNYDLTAAKPYFDLEAGELKEVIRIAEPLQMSAVPEISEAATKLVRVARMGLG